ncbi:hypothetical protein CRENBAI_024770 [Crenichthys baileyi]|uniref:Uncharacterized protein n=1 Tax=Crenichthys baileyi TaxID=28760 RepID=A0AAV9SI96_9TELE
MRLLIGLDQLQLRTHTCQSHPAIEEEAQLWAPPAPPPTTHHPHPAPLRQWRGTKASAEKEARVYSTAL